LYGKNIFFVRKRFGRQCCMAATFPLVAFYRCLWLFLSSRSDLNLHFFLCSNYHFWLKKFWENIAAWPPPSPWLNYTGVCSWFYLLGQFHILSLLSLLKLSFFVEKGLKIMLHGRHFLFGCIIQVYIAGFIFQVGFKLTLLFIVSIIINWWKIVPRTFLHGHHLPPGCIIQVYMVGFILQVNFIFFHFFLCYNYYFLLKKVWKTMLHGRHFPLGCILQVYIVGFICQVGFKYPFFLCLKKLLFFVWKFWKTMLHGRHLPPGCIIQVYMVGSISQIGFIFSLLPLLKLLFFVEKMFWRQCCMAATFPLIAVLAVGSLVPLLFWSSCSSPLVVPPVVPGVVFWLSTF